MSNIRYFEDGNMATRVVKNNGPESIFLSYRLNGENKTVKISPGETYEVPKNATTPLYAREELE